jgi:ABC-type iron transport system FetAB permease component
MATATRPPSRHGGADAAMRRLLRVPPAGPPGSTAASARRAFSTSIVVSGIRCLLTYVVLPFVAPALGLAAGVGPALGIVIGLVAIVANVASARRFWRANHPRRWAFTAIAFGVIVLLLVLLVQDVAELIG